MLLLSVHFNLDLCSLSSLSVRSGIASGPEDDDPYLPDAADGSDGSDSDAFTLISISSNYVLFCC